MRVYSRYLEDKIIKEFFGGKIVMLLGPRQVGKTTLIENILRKHVDKKVLRLNGDDPDDRGLINDRGLEFLKGVAGESKIIFIDEGKKVDTIGQTLKLLVDYLRDRAQIIVTGSSSLNLTNMVSEPLTGRKRVFEVYPISIPERYETKVELMKNMDDLLVYGSYPEVARMVSFEEKKSILMEINKSYLYKDILEFQQIRNPELLRKLLKALALQIGQEVSYTELSRLLEIDKVTVEKYVDLLEKNYVVFRLSPFTKNKRREISRMRKVFFYDVGVRNAVIGNFIGLDGRDDVGALFENLMIVERMKHWGKQGIDVSQYFWRTYDGKEIDLVEENTGMVNGFEAKWGKNKVVTKEEGFEEIRVVNKDNLWEFATGVL